MATGEGDTLDLSITAQAGDLWLALVHAVLLVIPTLTLLVLVLSSLRRGRSRSVTPLWCSRTTAGTRYLLGEINRSEYRRAVAGDRRVRSALR